ncbi:MAG TPA: alpha-hydroxy acid oxidase [Streptosporangiaceae bacterium]|nr:alpha-hydroxy acid oxidase [Streptosporangiaceae bacterium]
MNDFGELLACQLRTDLRELPARARARLSDQGRAARAGSIGELRAAARRALPRVVFDFMEGAAEDELTAARNVAELRATVLRPRVLVDVSDVRTATTVLGEPVALPLIGAPMGLTGLIHPGAEIALARALHEAGSVSVVSAMASCTLSEVAAVARGPLWFQMYIWRDRGLVKEMLRRVEAAGVGVLMLTLDVPRAGNRGRDRRNGFSIPPRVTLRALAGGVTHPRWSRGFMRNPRLGWGNLPGDPGGPGAGAASLSANTNRQFDPAVTWDDLGWFREHWAGPLVVKGILHPDDARRAVRLGADAVSVSNHGGRQLDGAPAAIRALPPVADAVAGQAEVYLDGGIRRGADIVKALALGARACLTGRALGYGLGVAGQAGVRRAVEILHTELRTTLALAGCPSVDDLDPSWVQARGPG